MFRRKSVQYPFPQNGNTICTIHAYNPGWGTGEASYPYDPRGRRKWNGGTFIEDEIYAN